MTQTYRRHQQHPVPEVYPERFRKTPPAIITIRLALCLITLISIPAFPQAVYQHVSHEAIYRFLDEMANLQLIDPNTAVKPFSRQQIAAFLSRVDTQREYLNRRQQKELDFYLRDYHKELLPGRDFRKRIDLLYHKDSLFTLSVNPIGGIRYYTNRNGQAFHRWNGAEAFAYVGKHWGFYSSLRDNHESVQMNHPDYLTRRMGAPYKSGNDYSEMRGGISYSWKWGSLGLVKDHLQWGNGYHGTNILSGRTPSFAMIRLHLEPADWFEFNYFHGWLVSEVVDSSRTWTYVNVDRTFTRVVYREKYMAANLFTFKPVKRLHVSFGNSIVYSDLGMEPAYLIPLFFFKSVDHTLNHSIDNQNSQMFLDISSRLIRHMHLYSTLFLDEISLSRMFDPESHSNFYSWKIGGRLSGFPLTDAGLTLEYTRTNPLVYKHYLPTLTFESNRYNLGHYLHDNATELYVSADYTPLRGVFVKAAYLHARKGPDYTSIGGSRLGLPFMETVEWENKTFSLEASWQVIHDGYVYFSWQ
ncbi:MAG: hypothetical protein ACP5D1_08325, partial [Bacteroidales bacterium]